MSTQHRTPAGVPTGGQFAASTRDEAAVSLDDATAARLERWESLRRLGDTDGIDFPPSGAGKIVWVHDGPWDDRPRRASLYADGRMVWDLGVATGAPSEGITNAKRYRFRVAM